VVVSARPRRLPCGRLVLLALSLLALVPDAAAQRRRSERARDREEAREWYRSGRAALEAGEPEAALASFEQAYALYPHWASMVGMGLAYQALGQIEQALVCFEQGLVEGGDDVPAAERADVESRIALLRAVRPPPPPPPPSPPPPRPIEPVEEGSGGGGWFWGLLGASGVLLGAAIGTGSYTLVLDREYHMPTTPVERLDEIRPVGEALQVTTDVLLGLAGAAALAAVVVLIVGDDDETPASAVALSGAGAGPGLGLTLRF